ncbi:MAG TPA: DJ-1/PfpI family protein [Lautropia sp.]|nr:DJ-1/PfpI family protein [Lautropia sp.]
MSTPRTVGILIFPEVEILDFCGPFEVFSSAVNESGEKLFNALTVAETDELVTCRGGLLVQPNVTFTTAPKFDIILAPGGYGTDQQQENPVVLDWLRRQRSAVELTTSVCTGAFLLGAAGILDGLRATSHWTTIERLRDFVPAATVLDDERVVDEGEVITSAGVSAGIDMALHVVRRLHGDAVAVSTARDMEYDWALAPA